ncbi:hypothetical protein GBA52_025932 [Prunus armeniaca]|nr:hypothetical protein GBA52_025932 [Prunus armeniaca]
MSNSSSSDSPSPTQPSHHTHPILTTKTSSSSSLSWPSAFLIFSVLGPLAIALLIYQLDSLDPAPLPLHELTQRVAAAPTRNAHMLKGSEFVGAGALVAPEDVAYDSKSGLIYTGCADGWVKRVTLNESAADSVVENWVFTGGRPLGLAHGHKNEVFVADTEKEVTPYLDLALRYPFIRKVLAIMKQYAAGRPHMEKNAGVLAVNLNGEPTAHYSDPELFLISSGIKIGNYLYCGSIVNPYIIRLDVHRHPAHPTT